MSTLAEHLAEIRANWDRNDVYFESMCLSLVRGHMKELETFVRAADQPSLSARNRPRTHAYIPHRKYPWFCDQCGYPEHCTLQHAPKETPDE